MLENLKLMLEKVESKLKTAKIDLENGQFDDSISRAYYAVFHAISAALLSIDLTFSSHSQVIGAFNKEFIKKEIFPKNYTTLIQGLFADRQIGDYDIISQIEKEVAEEGFQNANQIVSAIRSYLEAQ